MPTSIMGLITLDLLWTISNKNKMADIFVVRLTGLAFTIATALLGTATFMTSSCQPKTGVEAATVTKTGPKTSTPVAPEPQKQDDGWQRMKECAERADRMAKQKEWVEGKRIGDTKIEGWQNHYSAKYGRCYVQVFYEDHAAENANIVYFEEYDLYDAFQGMPLSVGSTALIFRTSSIAVIAGSS